MAASARELVPCRECGARPEDSEYCWLCGARLESPAHDVVPRPAIAQQQAGNTFGLSTLVTIVATCAVLFGVFRESPGLGILLAIVGTPALIKFGPTATAQWLKKLLAIVGTPAWFETRVSEWERKEASGQPMTGWQKLATFAVAVCVVVGPVVLIVVSVCVWFNATCRW